METLEQMRHEKMGEDFFAGIGENENATRN
jgi:hypothetical protein